MSAISNPSARPSGPAAGPQPAQPPAGPKRNKRRLIWIVAALVAAAGIAVVVATRSRPDEAKRAAVAAIRTAPVVMGPLERTLRIAGTTSARNFAVVGTPMLRGPDIRNLVLMKLVPSGVQVRKGDLLADVDTQAARDHVDDVESQVQQAIADIKKRMAEQAIETGTLRQTILQAKAASDKAKLDAGAAQVRTVIDMELLKLSAEEAEAHYKQVQTDVPNTVARQKAEIRILELTRDRHIRHRDRHIADIKRLTIRSPLPGLTVMQSTFRGGEMRQVQEGDQVSPGEPFMKIVDTSSMQIEAQVNQVEAEFLRIGQRAAIGYDAFPNLRMSGKVYAIGAIAVGGRMQNFYIRNIPVRVIIEGQDNRVIPDLSASADVLLERKENVLLTPLAAVEKRGSGFTVRVKTASGFETRAVELGARTNTHAEVLSGLKAGEQVAVGTEF